MTVRMSTISHRRGDWHSSNDIPENFGDGGASPGRFHLTTEIPSGSDTPVLRFENPYYDVGGRTYVFESTAIGVIPSDFTGFVALSINMTGDVPSATVVTFSSLAEMRHEQTDYSKYILPLYQLEDGSVKCDFRIGPPAVAGEFSG